MDKYFLYSQEGCEFCDDLKKVLDENSIRYKIKDVVRNRVEWEKVRMSQKIKYTPVFVIANADRRDVRYLYLRDVQFMKVPIVHLNIIVN